MQSLLSQAHIVYSKNITTSKFLPRLKIRSDQDLMSFFTSRISNDAYLGTPITKVHDFTFGALKTFAFEQSMFNMVDCLDTYELINVDKSLGMSQMLFEHSVQGKLEGVTNFVEAFLVYGPQAFETCSNAVVEDMQNLTTFAGRLNLYGTGIYTDHKHEWIAASG
jgi:hypothetical protein